LVRVERSKPAPWSTTLPIGEATAEPGREIMLQSGDVVTVLGPEADAAAPKDWKRYERSALARELARSDKDLIWRVEQRENIDKEFDALLEGGYPIGHPLIASVRERAATSDGEINSRMREILQPKLDEAAKSDEVLRGLLEKRAQVEQESNRLNPRMPGGRGDWVTGRLKVYAVEAEIALRAEELGIKASDPNPTPAERPVPEGWERYVASSRVTKAAETDELLRRYLWDRLRRDTEAEDLAAKGTPVDHRDVSALRQRALAHEAQINARVEERERAEAVKR
jgi:hypothetical protein